MKKILVSLAMLALGVTGGCASLQRPTAEALSAVPVVQFGEDIPTSGDFILYFPAGKPIPVVASIKGSALSKEAENTLNVTLKKDIYAYKQWVSFDRKNWQQAEQVLAVKGEIIIPGPEHPKPGLMRLQIDLK